MRRFVLVFLVLMLLCAAAFSQTATPIAPNADPVYQQLRHLTIGSEAISVNNLVLQRDAGRLVLKSGTVCFTPAVNGKVTGAVFVGDGAFNLNPPIAVEQRFVNILAKDNEGLHETFSELALRFGDDTYNEMKQKASGSGGNCNAGLLNAIDDVYRKTFHYNIAARLLQDVLSSEPGGYFAAMIKGKKYSSKELYILDPNGINMSAPGVENRYEQTVMVAPEEVAFVTYDSMKDVVWTSFHYSREYSEGHGSVAHPGGGIDIQKQKLSTTIERGGRVDGDAITVFTALQEGIRVVPFQLFSRLRVQSVSDAGGQPLNFIQEEKNDDPQFFVVLPKPLKAGEQYAVRTVYSGKDAVINEGGGNYYPAGEAREDWFPTNAATPFGDYASYEMEFKVPKNLTMVASGKLLKEWAEGNQAVSVWASEAPQSTAGFNLGAFKRKDDKVDGIDFSVQSFANSESPDYLSQANISTVSMMDKPLAEAHLAVQLYSDYFGPLANHHVAMTQQTACNYGQSWPYVVYLPLCAFLDDTIKHFAGLDDLRLQFWNVVGPHEVAHQWWGHQVGFNSYRDQWMSEGFAEFAASLFIQQVWAKDPKMFLDFWKNRREILLEKTRMGWRANDAGPVTLGYRLTNEKFGDLTFRLIYPKGGYILHMLRMMMWDRKNADGAFRAMMHDFTSTYANRVATTEDFKAMVEKHMLPQMDLDGNHRMDWFFNQYVYGTTIPAYNMATTFENQNGTTVMKFKLTQSNVPPDFKMLVPIYLELGDGRVTRLGDARLVGDTSVEQSVPLGQLKQPPKRAMVNYYYDVLSTEAK
jgi:hypothetical protein